MASELNKDQDVINEGRKNALTDVDAPLRDQIVKKLYDKLVEMKVPSHVDSIWNKLTASRVLWSEKQRAWLDSWDQHLVSDVSGAFEGSSQLHIPMPFTVIKTMHARFMQALWQDPPFNVKPQNEASTENINLVRDVLRFYLMRGANFNKGVGSVVDHWVRDWLAEGSGILKTRWEIQYSRFVDVETVMVPEPQAATIVKGAPVPPPRMVQKEQEVDRIRKCFDGPLLELVDLEDILIDGGNGDPQVADAVLQRTWLTASELWTLVDRKIFNKDAVEKIISGGPDRVDGSVGTDIKQDRARNNGVTNIDNDQDLDRYEITEAYLKLDVDGSGINSDVVVWVHRKSRSLARATYLYRISRSGRRPYAKSDFEIRKGQEFGVGMVEILYPLSKEMDAIHNMRLDFGLVSVMPFGFYRPTSGIDPETIKLEPGSLIPVDQPQTDVFFPNLGNRTSFGFQEEGAIQNMVERLTSISDLNLGMTSSQGATRTATGARALVGEMSSNLDVYLRRLNWGWEQALNNLLELLQMNIPQGLAFRLTGDGGADRFVKINQAKDIYGSFDIEVSPNSASSNAQIQEQNASDVLQLVSSPLAIQLQIVNPLNYYAALENYLKAKGVKDYSKFITKPQGLSRQLSPEEELNRVLRGIDVPVTPEMDHEGFLALFQHFHDTDELLGQFTEDQTILAAKQAQKHQQMLQALKQMQAQQANAAQMQRNSQMSTNPSSQGGAAPAAIPGQ